MRTFGECINEGFFGDSYKSYKNRVLDVLGSIGIVIDPSKMKHAESWIRDFYADRMSEFDCASSIRDNCSKWDRLTESFERYATEIVDSAPALQKKTAVKRIQTMDRVQKAQFDHVVLTLCGLKNLDPKEFLASRGYDILKLVQDGALNTDQIIERIGQQLLGKKNESMSVEEALEIIRSAGKKIDEGNEIQLGRCLCTRGFTHGNIGTLFKRGREYDVKEIGEDGRVLVGGFWVGKDFFIEHFMPLK